MTPNECMHCTVEHIGEIVKVFYNLINGFEFENENTAVFYDEFFHFYGPFRLYED